jgi:cytochrome c biogenesis protein CcmG, thiol:disulfide interchange protein DsbE
VSLEFNGSVQFVEENYGDSKLANRFGLTRYPAIFVDDILVATPNDFGFYGKGEAQGGGRYAPLQSAQSHDRLRADLTRMVRLILEGRAPEAREVAKPAADSRIAAFPDLPLSDLDGNPVTRDDLRGRVVIVDFWATWCPPCQAALRWLGDLKKSHGDRLVVLALAVESDTAKVRRRVTDLGLPFRYALSTPEVAKAFGDVSALPTFLLFDQEGKAIATYFGASPVLHAEAEAKVRSLLD